MHIVAVGLNYRTAPVEIREKFTFSAEALPHALKELRETKSVLECVIVATCNRTEIYAVVDRLQVCGHYVRSFMEKWFGMPRQSFNRYLYIKEGRDAMRHLFRVASGLDSMIIGETQILGQVRDAFLLAQQCGTTGTLFNELFKQAVTMAKRVHTELAINDNPVSVSYAAVELGKRIFGDFADKTVLIIGAGETGKLTAKHLRAAGASRVIVTNRTYRRAEKVAEQFAGIALPYEQMTEALAKADVVISSTGASEVVLTREQVRQAMRGRKLRPLFMIDIAVPRDLDPAIAELANVYLYDIDDLQSIVDANLEQRRQEAAVVERIIETELDAYEQWYKTLGLGPLIQALQLKAQHIHEGTMESLLNKLPDLNEREIKVIRKLTRSIINQMLRDPITRIKELAADRHGEEAVEWFKHIFALEQALAEVKAAESAEGAEPERTNGADAVKELPRLVRVAGGVH